MIKGDKDIKYIPQIPKRTIVSIFYHIYGTTTEQIDIGRDCKAITPITLDGRTWFRIDRDRREVELINSERVISLQAEEDYENKTSD